MDKQVDTTYVCKNCGKVVTFTGSIIAISLLALKLCLRCWTMGGDR